MKPIAILSALLLVACGSPGASDDEGGPDTGSPLEAGVDAPIVDASIGDAVGDAPSCAPSDASPTRSFALADWPSFTAATAPDWTAAAAVSSTSLAAKPAGVVVAPGGAWVFAALSSELVVMKRSGDSLTVDHAYPNPNGEIGFGVAISHDGKTLAFSTSDQLALFDVAKAEQNGAGALLGRVATQSVKKTSIDVAFSADGAFAFVALEYDDSVAVVDVAKQTYVGAIPIAGTAVTGVVVSPDGARLYVICELANTFAQANPNPAVDQVVGLVTVVDAAKATTARRAQSSGARTSDARPCARRSRPTARRSG
ncbi:MAG TPA: hypothetical protein VGH28_12285 [Polyangiaceae bacterium]|jgi:DNA-binding beta-propeller fold protein YncE